MTRKIGKPKEINLVFHGGAEPREAMRVVSRLRICDGGFEINIARNGTDGTGNTQSMENHP